METYSIKETVRAFISGDMAIVLYPEQTIKPKRRRFTAFQNERRKNILAKLLSKTIKVSEFRVLSYSK